MLRLKVGRDLSIDDDKEKHYSYPDLVDLHDRLTLVVGKKKEHQDVICYFEDVKMIFERFTRLRA